jgi:hypothetical protein
VVLVMRGIPPVGRLEGTQTLIGVMKNVVEIGAYAYPVLIMD